MAQVTIYTRDYCGYCARALQLLQHKGVEFTQINAGNDPAERKAMIARSGRTTYPQIFIGDDHIGGCDEMLALERQGKLDELLAA